MAGKYIWGDGQRGFPPQSFGGDLTAPRYLIHMIYHGSQFDKLVIYGLYDT